MAAQSRDVGGFDDAYFRPLVMQDPYPLYERLREREPVCWSDRMQAWVISRYVDVAAAYRSRLVGQGDRTWGYVRKMSRSEQTSSIRCAPICHDSSPSLTRRSIGRSATSWRRCSSQDG